MNPNEPFANPNLSEPRTTIIMGSNSREAAEALNALAAIKELHTRHASDLASCCADCQSFYPAYICGVCLDNDARQAAWPCATARAWGEK